MQSSSDAMKFRLMKIPSCCLFLAISISLSIGLNSSLLAQPVENGGTESGGPMSNRIKKYITPESDGMQGMGRRQRIQERLNNMAPEKREMFMQRMRERREQGGGAPGGPGAPDFNTDNMMTPGPNNMPGQEFGQGRRGGLRKGGMGMQGGGGMRKGFGGFAGKALDLSQLNLSEKQKNAIMTLRSKHGEQSKSLQKTLRTRRMELRNMLFSTDLNKKSLQEKRNEVRLLQNQMDDIMIEDFLGIRSQLTEEQIKKLGELNGPNQKRNQPEDAPRPARNAPAPEYEEKI